MAPDDFQKEVDKNQADQQAAASEQAKKDTINTARDAVVGAVTASAKANMHHRANTTTKVDVQNEDLAKTADVQEAVDAVNKLNLTTFIASQDKFTQMVSQMLSLSQELQKVANSIEGNGQTLDSTLSGSITKIADISKKLADVNITSNKDIEGTLKQVLRAVEAIDVNPQINVSSPDVKVPAPKVTVTGNEVDLTPLQELLRDVKKSIDASKVKLDLKPVTEAVKNVQSTIANLTFPSPNYVLPFKDSTGKAVQVQLDASGNIPTTGGGGGGGTVILSDGTNTPVHILKSDGTAAGQNSEMVAPAYQDVPFSFSAPGSQVIDVGNYKWAAVQITTVGTGMTFTAQASNDNSTYNNWPLQNITNIANVASSGLGTSATTYVGPIHTRYVKLNLTALASGTVAGVVHLSTVPSVSNTQGVQAAQSGTWTVGSNSATGSAVPANAFYIATNNGGNLTGLTAAANSGDGIALSGGLAVGAWIWNGTTFDRMRSGGVTGMVGISGDTASAAADAGNPVKIGTKYNATQPTFTDGQRGELQMSSRGELRTVITAGGTSVTINTAGGADAASNTVNTFATRGYQEVWNGTTWDRMPGDTTGVKIQDGGNSITVDGTVTANTTEVSPTTVVNGKTTVTTAGTRVALASSTTVKSVTIKALAANTGIIYVGSSTVASTNGYQLAAGDVVSMDIANLNTINIDSSVNGEGVTYIGNN